MRLSYVLFALLVFITLRVEASFFGHHHHGFGYYPVIAAAAPFYYAHYPLYSYHGFGYGGLIPFKNRRAAAKHRKLE